MRFRQNRKNNNSIKTKTDKARIGCSGYYYTGWKNSFYPPEVKTRGMLSFYSTVFNTVELNSPFYHIPKVISLQTQFNATHGDFKFSVKVNRTITHYKKLKDCKTDIKEFIQLITKGLGHKLGCILFQFPPSFTYSTQHAELIKSEIPSSPLYVLEFRHASWWNDDTRKLLKEKDLTFCNVDFPKLPTTLVKDSSVFYLRLHGTPVLFHSAYSDNRLKQYAHDIPAKKQVYVYFNNTDEGNAWRDAGKLRQYLEPS